ncbi:hypothetical protein QAD02_021991 [Eretmocerus hayati]|uniref:Uncharacterized protein n=1 Tax=Eretmocerus hayati TaxID=131215 RepID=A0ACC2PS11_9HYME|nr:hypothetical protein QAD02_021991 [Eretmocerus hayati]
MATKKMKRGQSREISPAVTWISLPPEEAARPNSRSDDLSESEKMLRKKNVAISPDTLAVLEEAERLIENAEQQLSMINCQTFVDRDLQSNRFGDKLGEEELYVREVVASMFEKGRYHPTTGIIVGDEHSPIQFDLHEERKIESHDITHQHLKPSVTEKIDKSSLDRLTEERECLVCKNNGPTFTTDSSREDGIVEVQSAERAKREKSKHEVEMNGHSRMNIQSGPTIDIQGEFSVQTSVVVDIQPVQFTNRRSTDPAPNIATFLMRHGSSIQEDASHLDPNLSLKTKMSSKDDEFTTSHVQMDSRSKSAHLNENRSKSDTRARRLHNQLDSKLSDGSISLEEIYFNNRFVKETNEMRSDDELHSSNSDDFLNSDSDVILNEPSILPEIDLLLGQREKLIRQVNNVIKECDHFLRTRSSYEDFPSLESTSVGIEDDEHESDQLVQQYSDLRGRNDERHESHNPSCVIESMSRSQEISNRDDASQIEHISDSIQGSSLEKLGKVYRRTGKIHFLPSNSFETNTNEQNKYFNKEVGNTQIESIFSKDGSSNGNSENAGTIPATSENTMESDSSGSEELLSEIQDRSVDQPPSMNNTNSSIQVSTLSDTRTSGNFIENFRNFNLLEANKLNASVDKIDDDGIFKVPRAEEQVHVPTESKTVDVTDKTISKDRFMKHFRTNDTDKDVQKKDPVNTHNLESEKCESTGGTMAESSVLESGQTGGSIRSKIDDIELKNSKSNLDLEDNLEKQAIIFHPPKEIFSPIGSENNLSRRDSLGLLHVSLFDREQDDNSQLIQKGRSDKTIDVNVEQKVTEGSSVTDNDLSVLMANGRIEVDASGTSLTNIFDNSTIESRNPLARTDGPKMVQMINFSTICDGKSATTDKSLETGSILTSLSRNSARDSSENMNLNLLKQLETYAMPRNNLERKLLTSTVLGDVNQSRELMKSESESSSVSSAKTHSEGEILISSSDTYSLGEVRRGNASDLSNTGK